MKMLVHTCCGPCLIHPSTSLRAGGFDITSLAYNPNIHPYTEYLVRLDTLERFCADEEIPLLQTDYDFYSYFQAVSFKEEKRCEICYSLRLNKAARIAKERAFPSFTTTLLVSPYQDHELVKKVGEQAGRGNGVLFYYDDFRSGYREALAQARRRDMYRQKYCGCIFSEQERLAKRKVTTP